MRNFFPTELIFLFSSFFLSNACSARRKRVIRYRWKRLDPLFFFFLFFRATSDADYTGCCDIRLG